MKTKETDIEKIFKDSFRSARNEIINEAKKILEKILREHLGGQKEPDLLIKTALINEILTKFNSRVEF